MYCGNNKTALESQRQISLALIELMSSSPFDRISVSSVCACAGVSRQTFYSLFSSKENVVLFILRHDCCCSDVFPKGGGDGYLTQISHVFSRYIIEHRGLIRLLSVNNKTDLLHGFLRDALSENSFIISSVQPSQRAYAADFIAAGITSIADTFVRQGCNLSPVSLEQLIRSMLGGSIFSSNRQ